MEDQNESLASLWYYCYQSVKNNYYDGVFLPIYHFFALCATLSGRVTQRVGALRTIALFILPPLSIPRHNLMLLIIAIIVMACGFWVTSGFIALIYIMYFFESSQSSTTPISQSINNYIEKPKHKIIRRIVVRKKT